MSKFCFIKIYIKLYEHLQICRNMYVKIYLQLLHLQIIKIQDLEY